MENEFIIDIQGFVDENSAFLPKEVAVVCVDSPYIAHWLVSQPQDFSDLPNACKRQNNWLTKNYHGIEWFEGDVNPQYIKVYLRQISRNAKRIYVRGKEKAEYLQKVTSRQIDNLEDITPAFRKLANIDDYCMYHGVLRNKMFMCALNNAVKLKKWLLSDREGIAWCTTVPANYYDKYRITKLNGDENSDSEGHDTIDGDDGESNFSSTI